MTILALGSSIFEQWTSISKAFPSTTTLNAAIGGTITEDWLVPAQQFCKQDQPELVAFYCGSNDISREIPPLRIIENLQYIINSCIAENCGFLYYYIIKSPHKNGRFAEIDAINQTITAYLQQFPNTATLDCNSFLCAEAHGDISPYYQADQLHLTEAAYTQMEEYTRTCFWSDYQQKAASYAD